MKATVSLSKTSKFGALLPRGALAAEVRESAGGLQQQRPSTIELRRWSASTSLLDYQLSLTTGIVNRALTSAGTRGMICLPTGAGKTVTAAAILLALMQARGDFKRCLWIAPQRELLFQAASAAQSGWWGGSGPPSLDLLVTKAANIRIEDVREQIFFVTSTQADKILETGISFDVAVFDEAHHVAAPLFNRVWGKVTSGRGCKLGLGLSATPYRGEHRELERLSKTFHGTLFLPKALMPTPVKALISRGILATPNFSLLDASPVERARWARRKTLQSLMLAPDRWDILISFLESAKGKTIVFCLTRAHGEALTRHLRFLGVSAEYVDGDTPLTSRFGVFERFRDGTTRIIINVGLFIEGVDCPSAEIAVITYPVRSKNRLAQMIGRVLRGPKVGGTPTATVVAFEGSQSMVDVTLQLSPTELSFWENVEQM